MDYFIVFMAVTTGLYFHWWIYVRIKRWMDRDLALAQAGGDADKQTFMLQRLAQAQASGIKRRDLPQWLERAAAEYGRD